jgi:ComEC/Rec2-related protein
VFALRPRKPFVGLTVCAVAGIVAADWLSLPTLALLWILGAVAIVALIRPMRPLAWVVAFLTFALLHTARHVDDSARHFAAGLAEPRPFVVEGVVWSEPVVFSAERGSAGATFWLKLESCEPAAPIAGRLCLARWAGLAPVYGERVRMRGSARTIEEAGNPGQFDVGAWLARQGIHFEVKANGPRDCEIVGQDGGDPLRRFGMRGRAWIKQQLDRGLPRDPETETLISSMVLGLRGDAPPELKELFQKTGTLHLFAVSGLNVGMLIVIAWYALKPAGARQKSGALLIIPLLAAYAVIVGMSASCLRATVVGAMILAAPLWEREAIPLNSLGAAAFAILAFDTNELFNPGFQLSFVLVVVILALSPLVQKPVERWSTPDDFIPRRLWNARQRCVVATGQMIAGTIAVGLAAWAGSLFFMWGYFHLLSPVALLANLVAVPLAFCVLALGLLSLIVGLIPYVSAPAIAVNHANWACARALIASVHAFAQVPSGHVYAERPTLQRAPLCEVVALDVGAGAAIHARAGAGDWLIDAGHERDYSRLLLPYLRSRGVDRLDGMLLTHGDAAHLGGALPLIDDFHPGWIGEAPTLDRSSTRRALHAQLAERKLGRRFYCRGDCIRLGSDVRLRVLYPPRDLPPQNVADDKALVFRLEAANRRILLTSDIGFSAETWLLKNESALKSDVLIKGWADRDFSGTPDFIRAVQPSAVVCAAQSFGAGEREFDEWAQPLRERGIVVLSQPECGAVRVTIERSGDVQVTPWRR